MKINKIEKYNSVIHTAEVRDIDAEVYDIGLYPMIVKYSTVSIDYDYIEHSHQTINRGAIGSKADGKTLLVDVYEGRGMTVKELAQFMIDQECIFACSTPFLPIVMHEAEEEHHEEDVVKAEEKPKKKK